MADDITISGGGSTQVASDSLLDAESRLQTLGSGFDDLAEELRPALALTGATDAARFAHNAATGIRAASAASKELARHLQDAAEQYGAAERDANSHLIDLSVLGGWALGRAAPLAAFAAAMALPEFLSGLAVLLGAGALATGSPKGFLGDLGRMLGSKASMLRDPRVVSLIRFAVSAADDGMLGAAGVPLPLTALADDRRSGLFGLHGATSVVVGAGSLLGMLRETPVTVERTSTVRVAPPASYSELAARIPPTSAESPQVRIERYDGADGKPVFMVYVGGTVDTSPTAAGEPFDITSDLTGVAQLDPASLRATESAMRQAGVQPGDTVIPVGYSQGGIIATDIATSGEYETPSLITFGSPTGGIDVPPDTVDVAVEHTDDLVPALGGEPREFDNGGGDRIVVSRQTYSGEVPSGSSPIDAHLMKEYQLTAQKMDASTDPRLASALGALPAGGSGDAELYRGVRVPADAPTSKPPHGAF